MYVYVSPKGISTDKKPWDQFKPVTNNDNFYVGFVANNSLTADFIMHTLTLCNY